MPLQLQLVQQPARCTSQRAACKHGTQSGRLGAAVVGHLTAAGLLRTLHALGCELQGQAMAAPACGCLSACVAASSTLYVSTVA